MALNVLFCSVLFTPQMCRCVRCYTRTLNLHWKSSSPACLRRTWTCISTGTNSLGVGDEPLNLCTISNPYMISIIMMIVLYQQWSVCLGVHRLLSFLPLLPLPPNHHQPKLGRGRNAPWYIHAFHKVRQLPAPRVVLGVDLVGMLSAFSCS